MTKTNKKLFVIYYALAILYATTCQYFVAKGLYNITTDYKYAYYWTDYRLSAIVFGNNTLLIGGSLAFFQGTFYCRGKKLCNITTELISDIFLFTVLMLLLNFTLSVLIFGSNEIIIRFNIWIHSFNIFMATFIFLSFWAIFGLLIYRIFLKRWIVIFLYICDFILEIIISQKYGFNYFNKYLPISISREIVIWHNQFWNPNSWSYTEGTFAYGNISMIRDANFQPVGVSQTYVYSMLLLYLSVVFFLLKLRVNKEKTNEV